MNSKYSFTTMATPELDLPAQVSVAKEYGFQGVDFRVGQPGRGEIPEDLTFEQAEEIKTMMGDLQIPGLLCYNQKIQSGVEEMSASILWCIHIARLLDCPMIRLFTGKIETGEELAMLTQALLSALGRDDSLVKLGLQIHKNNGLTVAQGLQLCKMAGNDRIGLILSPDQSYLAGEDWEPLIPEVAKHTFQIYVADLDSAGDFCLIGDGILDYRKIIDQLKSHGFNGFVTLKWEKCWIPQLPEYPEAFSSFINYMESSAQ